MLALLFDIHGNLPALEAVVADARAQGADRWLLGGDYVVFGGWPAETVAKLRELAEASWIRGNVDRWAATALLTLTSLEMGSLPAGRCSTPRRSAFSALCRTALSSGGRTRAWHASPKSDMESFMPEPLVDEEQLLQDVRERRLIFGHFHVSFERPSAGGVELVAPGSVGMPFDGDHRAAYALLHNDGRVERRRVTYDHAASAARVRAVAEGAAWGELIATRIERAAS